MRRLRRVGGVCAGEASAVSDGVSVGLGMGTPSQVVCRFVKEETGSVWAKRGVACDQADGGEGMPEAAHHSEDRRRKFPRTGRCERCGDGEFI